MLRGVSHRRTPPSRHVTDVSALSISRVSQLEDAIQGSTDAEHHGSNSCRVVSLSELTDACAFRSWFLCFWANVGVVGDQFL